MAKDDGSNRPYLIEDLAKAMVDWETIDRQYREADQMVAAKRSEMESFERTRDKLGEERARYKAVVLRIARNLEK